MMEQSMNLTLLVDKRTRHIIYAEAGKDFVDFLFSFLTMPIGSVIKVLSSSPSKKVGSVTNLYDSMDKLPSVYMKANQSVLLSPITNFCHKTLSIDYGQIRFYFCGKCDSYNSRHTRIIHKITNRYGQKCSCGQPLQYELCFGGNDISSNAVSADITGSRSSCDYVKENVRFLITDDLTISPSSTIASITLLNRMNVNDISQLEQKSVMVGPQQAMKLLWASLVSASALNDVFSTTVSTPTKEGVNQMAEEGV